MILKEVEFVFTIMESPQVRVINLSYFEEALLSEMTYHNKKAIMSIIYRSPSQSNNEFDSFLSNLEKLASDINNRKPALPILQLVWCYKKKTDPNNIRKVFELVNWERLFDEKSIDAQVATFTDITLNTFGNFVSNKYIIIDDKDHV